jgi:hypothetical protein
MDPLSPAASIIEILQVSEKVLTSCYRYVGKTHSASSHLEPIIRQVGYLKTIFLDLQSLVPDVGSKSGDGSECRLHMINHAGGPLAECFSALSELDARLPPDSGSVTMRRCLLRSLESKSVDEILARIKAQEGPLQLALASESVANRQEMPSSVAPVQASLEAVQMQEKREAVLNWLRWHDQREKHIASRKLHQEGSSRWILQSEAFEAWMTNANRLCWIYGIPGAGKVPGPGQEVRTENFVG